MLFGNCFTLGRSEVWLFETSLILNGFGVFSFPEVVCMKDLIDLVGFLL